MTKKNAYICRVRRLSHKEKEELRMRICLAISQFEADRSHLALPPDNRNH